MTYRGHVKDGVVIFDQEGAPPDGTPVRIETVAAAEPGPSIWEKLRRYSGALKGLPRDLARNHDHYIHGGPKK
jgi:hypothetical protein